MDEHERVLRLQHAIAEPDQAGHPWPQAPCPDMTQLVRGFAGARHGTTGEPVMDRNIEVFPSHPRTEPLHERTIEDIRVGTDGSSCGRSFIAKTPRGGSTWTPYDSGSA